jgi:hypothetical protein
MDTLGLEAHLREALNQVSYESTSRVASFGDSGTIDGGVASPKGAEGLLYVDTDSLPDAYSCSGRYIIQDEKLTAFLTL